MSTITTFHAVLKGLPRAMFNRCVKRHGADKRCKRFRHWDHLLAMVYAQVSGTSSLRTLELNYNSHAMHHSRLCTRAIHRSTLSWAGEHHSTAVFDDTAAWLLGKVSRKLRQNASSMMCLLDSTPITLKGRGFDKWTLENRTRNTQGIKWHVLLDAASHIPLWHDFSAPNVNDVTLAWQVPLQRGAMYVFDKGYCDYNWWAQIDAAGARFVTRLKSNAGVEFVEDLPISDDAKDVVLHDELMRFKHTNLGGGRKNCYHKVLRRITIHRPDKATPLILVTNDLDSSALAMGQCYKERWEIELFFKWLKQHLKIKAFIGRSENAVHLQIVTALIAYLLVALYKQTHQVKYTLWHCLSLITATLFEPPIVDFKPARTRPKSIEAVGARQCGGL